MKNHMKSFFSLVLAALLFFAGLPFNTVVAFGANDKDGKAIPMYRLYNPNSGEHFYTGSSAERNNLYDAGRKYEGVGWLAPEKSDRPVYRLYNKNAGDHHYTTDKGERNALVKLGWKNEGTAWYSDDAKQIPLYRQYNPNAKAGSHNYTASKAERDRLISAGWKNEGIAWYAVGNGYADPFYNEKHLSEKIDKKIKSLSLEDKVAQMICVTPEGITGGNTVTVASSNFQNAINRIPVGGIILMKQNIKNTAQTTELNRKIQQYSESRVGLPAFICVDEEGGSVRRISGNSGFPEIPQIGNMSDLGKTKNTALAYSTGQTVGSYLKRLGFTTDLAPVADVLTNPNNRDVRYRTFGTDPTLVSNMAAQFASGLHASGELACYKHFPGNGSGAGDTHEGYVYNPKTLAELEKCELVPYKQAIKNGIQIIMVAHIALPNVTGDHNPASLSPKIVTDLLRKRMGYEGICMTDALDMGAVAQHYSIGEASIKAVEAGEDMLLMSDHADQAYQAVLSAVRSGCISEARINTSVRRILKVKYSM